MPQLANPPTKPPVEALLRRFHSQRPLRGGSLLMTIFGDAIAPRGGAVTLGSLIDLAQPFGLAERLVRTAVARLAAEGWVAATRHGRRSEYRITESGRKLFVEATRRIYGVIPSSWDGQWTLAVLPPSGARGNSLRAASAKTQSASGHRRNVREELRWLGFGQLSPGVYAHPACTLEEARGWLLTVSGAGACWIFKSATEGVAADRRLAAEGWDLVEIGRRYRRFRDTFAPVAAAMRESDALPPQAAFLVRTLLVHEYRKIHLQDPLLPPPLLPTEWVGTEAYELTARLYAAVFATAEHFLTERGRTIKGALPPASPEVHARFGGTRAGGSG
ncbi:MAG TPA: phenylacetic acid degradation operon negative regulatory protein PaaX [Steroidobacteraceae bacterium]|nr:phenylacetic acid degradation operon negative regulatory protein PaaX [Steroidobacteraceae bacterium]